MSEGVSMCVCRENKGRKRRMPKGCPHLLSEIGLNRKLCPEEGIAKHGPGSCVVSERQESWI